MASEICWTYIEERLPDRPGWYLVACSHEDCGGGRWVTIQEFFDHGNWPDGEPRGMEFENQCEVYAWAEIESIKPPKIGQ